MKYLIIEHNPGCGVETLFLSRVEKLSPVPFLAVPFRSETSTRFCQMLLVIYQHGPAANLLMPYIKLMDFPTIKPSLNSSAKSHILKAGDLTLCGIGSVCVSQRISHPVLRDEIRVRSHFCTVFAIWGLGLFSPPLPRVVSCRRWLPAQARLPGL